MTSELLDKLRNLPDEEYHELKMELLREINEQIKGEVRASVNEIEGCISIIGWLLQSPQYISMPIKKRIKFAREIYKELISQLDS